MHSTTKNKNQKNTKENSSRIFMKNGNVPRAMRKQKKKKRINSLISP